MESWLNVGVNLVPTLTIWTLCLQILTEACCQVLTMTETAEGIPATPDVTALLVNIEILAAQPRKKLRPTECRFLVCTYKGLFYTTAGGGLSHSGRGSSLSCKFNGRSLCCLFKMRTNKRFVQGRENARG